MINFSIKNFFKDTPSEEPASLEVQVEVPKETREEAFNKAVEDKTKQFLRQDLNKALFILVHGEECYSQTAALSKDAGVRLGTTREKLEKYPKARLKYGSFGCNGYPYLEVNAAELLDFLVEKAYEED